MRPGVALVGTGRQPGSGPDQPQVNGGPGGGRWGRAPRPTAGESGDGGLPWISTYEEVPTMSPQPRDLILVDASAGGVEALPGPAATSAAALDATDARPR